MNIGSVSLSQQFHLAQKDRVNLGSYYTPDHIVEKIWEILEDYLSNDTYILDSSCGYGNFLSHAPQTINKDKKIGADLDESALDVAKQNTDAEFFHTNSLNDLSRGKYNIPQKAPLIILGNPPYNDRTSMIRHWIKTPNSLIDQDLTSRDLGISFLLSYNKLQADTICVLHPLSYLIKPANFAALRSFAVNYKLKEGLLLSSQEFYQSSKTTSFPIIIALYERTASTAKINKEEGRANNANLSTDNGNGKDTDMNGIMSTGMDYDYIKSFQFSTGQGVKFCLEDFDYISNYVDKYPRKSAQQQKDKSQLLFWTLRDINALKRNRTFVHNYSSNAIVIDKSKLEYYIYIDVFKRNIHRLAFYFGNCDVLINDSLFQQHKASFIQDAVNNNPWLSQHIAEPHIEDDAMNASIDQYFHQLLGAHHATT